MEFQETKNAIETPETLPPNKEKNDRKIQRFMSDYSNLITDETPETLPPDVDFKHRNVTTLFLGEEGVLFEKLLDGESFQNQIDMLIAIMILADARGMNTLYKKTGAIIAMKLKDKRVNAIREVFDDA